MNQEIQGPAVTLVGLGGIGTALLPALVRLRPEYVTLWDDDFVSEDNLKNQLLWKKTDVGKAKAVVVADWLSRSDIPSCSNPLRYQEQQLFDSVVIAAVDSMESRRSIWRGVMASPKVGLFLDGRLSRENPYFFQFFTIPTTDPEAREFYESWLEVEGGADSGRRDQDMVAAPQVLSGFMAMMIVRWSRGDRLPRLAVWDGVGMSLTPFD